MEGTLDISGATLTQRSSRTIRGKVLLPTACLSLPLPGDGDLPGPAGLGCVLVEAVFKAGADAGFPTIDASSCAASGAGQGSCACTVADARAVDVTSPMSSDGGVLRVRDSQTSTTPTTRTYNSCANGGTLTYREISASVAIDTAIYTLH
jgi:hypothetical protein